MRVNRWVKRLSIACFAVLGCGGLFCFASNRAVLGSAEGKIFTDTRAIPSEPVALVLGCAPIINGGANPFFWHRMTAAAALYKAGKVQTLLVSGDNGTVDYDEPTAMRNA